MATFIATIDLTIRDQPSFAGARIGTVAKDQKVDGAVTADPMWFQVTRSGLSGYLPFAFLRAESPEISPMTDSDRDRFCSIVTAAARDHEVDRDYLLALAFVLSNGINNDKATDSDAFGPFRFTPAAWNTMVERLGAANGITADMLFQWWEQPTFAAILTQNNIAALSATLGRDPVNQEIFFAHLFGADVAAQMFAPAIVGADFTTALAAAFPNQPPGPYAVDGSGQPRKVQEVLIALGQLLGQGLLGCNPIFGRQEPDVGELRMDAPQIEADIPVVADGVTTGEPGQTFTALIRLREGVRRTVYRDTLGKPTVGIGHLVVPADNLNVGDTITDQRVNDFFKVDGARGLDAAKAQATEAMINDLHFIAYLGSVNYQLGIGWRTIFPVTWQRILQRRYKEAADGLSSTKWAAQTPVRVADFQEALRRL